jgi:hypothetical protein
MGISQSEKTERQYLRRTVVIVREREKKTHLLPNSSLAPQLLARRLLRLRLVDFDHAAVQLRLVHIVDGFVCVFGLCELDVAEASVSVLG